MHGVVVEKPGQLVIRQIEPPKLTPYTAIVKMEMASICNGTDSKIKDGHFPGFDTYPTTLGHEGIGTVVEVGRKATAYKVGDRIWKATTMYTGIEGLASGWGAMAQYAVVGDFASMQADGVCDAEHGYDGIFEVQQVIPPEISTRQAILMITWREIYSSFAAFGFSPGCSLMVIGGGPVGLSFVRLAKIFGMKPVCLATRSKWKLDKALALGADAVFPADKQITRSVKDAYPDGFDFVIDAVGSGSVISQALQMLKFGATVGVYGVVAEDTLSITRKGAPLNWVIRMHMWPDYPAEAAATEPICRFVRQGDLSSEEFITHELPFDRIAEGFELIRQNKALKVVLNFD
ncbi:MAG: zinc-binding dehydrogenase [Planctomycetota bacterium]|nr:zinc-binding dehydrogenase [Planctomycetota bacterium]